MKYLSLILVALMMTTMNVFAAGTVSGKVLSSVGNEPLIGANVTVVGTKLGAITNSNGEFTINEVKAGKHTVRASYMGYNPMEKTIVLKDGETINLTFNLGEITIESRAINVVASRAVNRETPVAFSNISKQQLADELGSRDIPMILNTTPGVYATETGGGAGDSRINIRGFDQRNVSVMINGVPVNDMENGWVYWSNWDGLGDVTSSIQVQRGLGAGRMANPSVGGTMNIVTDAANLKGGASFKQEVGAGSFLKSTLVANTGKIGNFAASIAAVRKTGEGLVEKTWTDAYAYYVGLSYDISKNHQLDFYVIGAPQEHGQRSYSQNIAKFDHDLAKDAGMADSNIVKNKEMGLDWNQHWGSIQTNAQYPILNYYNNSSHDVRDASYLMERENYYHKPQMNLNWFWKINDVSSLTSVVYYSMGIGGGSGPAGSLPLVSDQASKDYNQIDFQQIYNFNISDAAIDTKYSATERKAKGILRNSVNQHNLYGYLGTFETKLNKNLTIQTGVDLRGYTGAHWYEVRNLLGADYYIDQSDKTLDYIANPTLAMKKLGDKFSYHNDGNVAWYGGFAQGEYKADKLTTYLNLSASNTGYKRLDYFRLESMPNGRETDWQNFLGYTAKTGANYNIDQNFNVFGNVGYYSRAPLFRNVYYYDNSVYDNITNEKVTAIELGAGYYTRPFQINFNLYWTKWDNRSWYTSSYTTDAAGIRTYYNYNLPGIGADHKGVEVDFTYRPFKFMKVYGMISLGDWRWTSDVHATFSPEDVVDSLGNPVVFKKDLYLTDIKVSDAAQTTAALSVAFYPIQKTSINFTYNYFADYYSAFNPEYRTKETDRTQPWTIPSYGLLNANINSTLPLNLPIDIKLFANAYNLLDTKFISDATDGKDHTANTATVFVGLPLRWNVGVQIVY